MTRIVLLTLAALCTIILAAPAARADCDDLKARFQGLNLTEFVDQFGSAEELRAAAEECGDPSLFGLLYNGEAAEQARPVTTPAELEGFWVNDFWLHVAAGLAIPVIETLEIAADGALKRRVVRFSDPRAEQHLTADVEMVLPDLMPLLAEGRLEATDDGHFRVARLREHDPELEYGREDDPEGYEERVAMVRAPMPDLKQPFSAARTEDALVIRAAAGAVRSYSRFEAADMPRLQALILVAEISAGDYWPCLSARLRAGGDAARDLRRLGDVAAAMEDLQTEILAITAKAHNAQLTDPDAVPTDAKAKLAPLYVKMGKLTESEDGRQLRAKATANPPFGCAG